MASQLIHADKIHERSGDTAISQLDILGVPPTSASIVQSTQTEYHSLHDISKSNDIEINVPASTDKYTDLASTHLKIRLKVSKEDGTALLATNAAVVWIQDNLGHSLFEDVTLYINDKVVEYTPNYPVRAFLETAIDTNEDVRKTILFSEGWSEDGNVGKEGTASASDTRKDRISGSKFVTLIVRPRLSMLNQDRMLSTGNALRLVLRKAVSKTYLAAASDTPTAGTKVVIDRCGWVIRRVLVNDAIVAAHTRALFENNRCLYPQKRVNIKEFTIPIGVRTDSKTISTGGALPNKVIIAIRRHAAKSGSYLLNPLKFGNNNLSKIELLLDGIPHSVKYAPQYDDDINDYVQEYDQLFANTGRIGTNTTPGITYSQYKDRLALYAWDTTPDQDSDAIHVIKTGTVSIDYEFSTATTEALSLVVYQTTEELVEIGAFGEVTKLNGAL